MAPVAELLGLDRTTLTAALKPLKRRALLVVETDAADRRSRRLRLTEAGHAVLLRALPLWKQTHAAIRVLHLDVHMDELMVSLRQLGFETTR